MLKVLAVPDGVTLTKMLSFSVFLFPDLTKRSMTT